MAVCESCGKGLGLIDRAKGRTICAECAHRIEQERQQAEADELARVRSAQISYDAALATMMETGQANPGLPALEVAAKATTTDIQERKLEAARAFVRRVIADDYLSKDEEDQLDRGITALGVDLLSVTQGGDLAVSLRLAQVNAGRLTDMTTPVHALLKAGEMAHWDAPAVLLKEVTLRETRGGYQGISFRVAKGVRLNTGGFKGRSVVVGTKIEVADTGYIVVTSRRAIFAGERKTLEFLYPKLVSIEGFEDGIRLGVSNRQTASTFKLQYPELVLATINTAASRTT